MRSKRRPMPALLPRLQPLAGMLRPERSQARQPAAEKRTAPASQLSTTTVSRPSSSSQGSTASGPTRCMLQHRIVTHMALRSLAHGGFHSDLRHSFRSRLECNLLERHASLIAGACKPCAPSCGSVCSWLACSVCLLVTFGVPSPDLDHPGPGHRRAHGSSAKLHPRLLRLVHSHGQERNTRRRLGRDQWQWQARWLRSTSFAPPSWKTVNWAEKGHPTGRRATFINNFAVTGQFFNFSTVGQWMWDEMSMNIPASAETYCQGGASFTRRSWKRRSRMPRLAEEEWKRVPRKSWLEPGQRELHR